MKHMFVYLVSVIQILLKQKMSQNGKISDMQIVLMNDCPSGDFTSVLAN